MRNSTLLLELQRLIRNRLQVSRAWVLPHGSNSQGSYLLVFVLDYRFQSGLGNFIAFMSKTRLQACFNITLRGKRQYLQNCKKIICVQAYCGKHCCFLRKLINEIPVFCFLCFVPSMYFVLCVFHVLCAFPGPCIMKFVVISCPDIVHFQTFCVFFSIFCAREKSQKTGRICSRGSLLLTLLGSWERKGGFIKQFYLKNSALLSLICYLKEQTVEIYDNEEDHKVNLRYKFSNTFFGRSAFTGVWVGVILAFLPWVQVELGGRK